MADLNLPPGFYPPTQEEIQQLLHHLEAICTLCGAKGFHICQARRKR